MTSANLARLRAELGDKPLLQVPEPTVADVAVGWSVYERIDPGADYWPRGGVVVHIDRRKPDPDAGELVDRYLLVKASKRTLVWVTLRSDQLQPPTLDSRPNAATILGVCEVAARKLVTCENTERALELWSLGAKLTAVLARPTAVSPSS